MECRFVYLDSLINYEMDRNVIYSHTKLDFRVNYIQDLDNLIGLVTKLFPRVELIDARKNQEHTAFSCVKISR